MPRHFESDETVEVVGESHYQDALAKVAPKPKGRDRITWSGKATLVADPKNKFDANAVRVEINGRAVGHLERAIAKEVQAAILRLGGKVTVAASLTGGFQKADGSRASIGVELHFDPADIARATAKRRFGCFGCGSVVAIVVAALAIVSSRAGRYRNIE